MITNSGVYRLGNRDCMYELHPSDLIVLLMRDGSCYEIQSDGNSLDVRVLTVQDGISVVPKSSQRVIIKNSR